MWKSELTNAPPQLNSVIASNLNPPITYAPLINLPPANSFLNNNNYRVHKILRSVPPLALKPPDMPLGQKFVSKMSHWCFQQHISSIVNQGTTAVNSVPQSVQAYIAPSTTNVLLQFYQNWPLSLVMRSPSGIQQENLINAASNVVTGLANPMFQPKYSFVEPIPLSWRSLQVSASAPPLPENTGIDERTG